MTLAPPCFWSLLSFLEVLGAPSWRIARRRPPSALARSIGLVIGKTGSSPSSPPVDAAPARPITTRDRASPRVIDFSTANHFLQNTNHQRLLAKGTKYTIPITEYNIPNTKYSIPNAKYSIPNAEYTVPNAITSSIQNANQQCLFVKLALFGKILCTMRCYIQSLRIIRIVSKF